MNKLAEIVAEKVINKIKKNQEEWDKQFYEEFKEMESGVYNAGSLSEKEKLRNEIQKLTTAKAECVELEQYELIPVIEKKLQEATIKYNNL